MNNIKYRKDIDGLRAVAVILVLIYHAFPKILTGGFVGVDVFFVISGYLITSIILSEMKKNEFSIKEFYRRRIDRIYPSLLAVLISSYAFGWFVLLPDEYGQHGKLIAASSVFLTNVALFMGSGYFDISSTLKPLLHLWSLGIEEQFYLIFPVALLLLYKRNCNIFFWLTLVAIVSFSINLIAIDADKVFYLPYYRLWELLSGSLLAIRKIESKNNLENTKNIQSVVGLLLILIPALTFTPESTFPGWMMSLPIAGTCLIISAGERSIINSFVLSSRFFVYIGIISYPLYLWHWPLLSFTFIIYGQHQHFLLLILLLFASFILAALTYQFIEKPLRSIRSWKLKTIPLFFMVIVIGVIGLYTYSQNGLINRDSISQTYKANEQLIGPLWQYTQNETCTKQYQTTLSTTLPWWYCFLKKQSDPDVILLGNSYANQLYPAFALNKKLKDLNVLSIGIYDPTVGVSEGSYQEIKNGMELTLYINDLIKSSNGLKYIVIGGLDPNPSDEYVKFLIKRIHQVEGKNTKIIIFLPHLIIDGNVKSCINRPLNKAHGECEVSFNKINKLRGNFQKIKNSVSIEFPDVLFFDPNSIFCNEVSKTCSSMKNGLPLYRDEYHHLSPFASGLVGESFGEWAKKNVPDILK